MIHDSWTLKTNKTAYVSGETVRIFGNLVGQSGAQNVQIQIYDPTGTLSRSAYVPVSSGSFAYSIKLTSDTPSGQYKILSIPQGQDNVFQTQISHSADKFGDIKVNMSSLSLSEPNVTYFRDNATITWINDEDSQFHTVSSIRLSDGQPDNIIETGFIPPRKASTITIGENDTTEKYYICKLHPSEKGILLPEGADKKLDSKTLNRFDTVHQKIAESTRNKLDVLQRHFNPVMIDAINYDEVAAIDYRLLTIVFWDIKGFSTLAISLEATPDLLLGFLREYFEVATQIIHKHGGALDKFIGDGVMAIFGLQHREIDGSESAKDAARAAAEFRMKFDEIKEKWIMKWSKAVLKFDAAQLGLKCGINTGRAISGNLGTEQNDLLTAIGNTVNFANRLCDDIGEDAGHIYISNPTRANIASLFAANSIGEVDIRNIGKYEIFELGDLLQTGSVTTQKELGKGDITSFNIPNEIGINSPTKTSAQFFGSVEFGFLTLCLVDSFNTQNWFPDPNSADIALDTGKLHFRNDKYSSEWEFVVTATLKPGKCTAMVGMYEDPPHFPFKSRRVIAFDQKEITLV